MLSRLRQFISWLFLKTLFCVFLAAAVVALFAAWIHLHDDPDFEAARSRALADLRAEQSLIRSARDEVAVQLAAKQIEVAAQQQLEARAEQITGTLRSLESWWKRWITEREQQRRNAAQIDHLADLRKAAAAEEKKLTREAAKLSDELKRRERRLRNIDARIACAEKSCGPVTHYLSAAWWLARGWALAAVCVYVLGPTFCRFHFFYFFAPRVARGRPIRLADSVEAFPWLGESATTVETTLWPGEAVRVRRGYIDNAGEGLVRRSRLLLSRRLPFTSILIGFVCGHELRNVRAGGHPRVTFTDRKNCGNEMTVVHLPEGGTLVLRPSYLVAIAHPLQQRLKIRRRWRLLHWQSWVSGQFRHLQIVGPCRMIISAKAGLRAERLAPGPAGEPGSCRADPECVIGFTPNLDFRLVRTPRFWTYYWRRQRLYDAHFSGEGFVLLRAKDAAVRPLRGFTRLWCAVRDPLLKLLGL